MSSVRFCLSHLAGTEDGARISELTQQYVALGETPEEAGRIAAEEVVAEAQAGHDSLVQQIADAMPELQQSAYHGTPHIFDRFSLEAIGTGEGAQAFGWGLYFASNREIAETYREVLTNSQVAYVGHVDDLEGYLQSTHDLSTSQTDLFVSWVYEGGWRDRHGAENESLPEFIESFITMGEEDGDIDTGDIDKFRAAALDEKVSSTFERMMRPGEGSLFQVDIPEDDQLLDWDAPLVEQMVRLPGIGEAIKFLESKGRTVDIQSWRGEQLYDRLEGLFGRFPDGNKQASEYLNSVGIPGLKYLESGGTGGINGDSHNYVIWDESVVTVEAVNDELRQAEEVEGVLEQSAAPEAWSAAEDVDGMPAFQTGDFTLNPVNEIDRGDWAMDDPNLMSDNVDNGFTQHGLMGHGDKVAPGSRTFQYQIKSEGVVMGVVVLDVTDGNIKALHDINIDDQGQGLGEQVVKAIVANTNGSILIAEIVPDSVEFWEKMGIGYINHDNDAQLNWEGYYRSRIGEPRSDAGMGEEQTGDTRGEGISDADKETDAWLEDYLSGVEEHEPGYIPTEEQAHTDPIGEAERSVESLRGDGATVLGNRVAQEFTDQGKTHLIGQTINSPGDLATLGQVYRNPAFETLRYFFIKDGVVVGQTGVTSRMPGFAAALPNQTKADFTPEGGYQDMIDQMNAVGADGFYMLHNHPTGDPSPSSADVSVTRQMGEEIPGFLGHVIVNHTQFATIDVNGDVALDTLPSEVIGEEGRYNAMSQASIPHPLLGGPIGSPVDLAKAANQLRNEDRFQLVSQGRNGVTGVMDIPLSELERGEMFLAAEIRKFSRQTGGSGVFAVNTPTSHIDLFAKGIEKGLFTDVLTEAGDSLRSDMMVSPDLDVEMGREGRFPGIQVREDSPQFVNWAGTTDPVIDPYDVNDFDFSGPGPFVMRSFHGTTHQLEEFDASVKGNKEGQFGAVNYFTSDEGDAQNNYVGEGPDLTNRIEQRAEQIEQEFEDADEDFISDLAEEHELEFNPETETYPEDLPKVVARKELSGGEDQVLEVFIRTEKPFIVGTDQSPWVEFTEEVSNEDAMDRVADNTGVDIADIETNPDEYQDEIDEARWELMDEGDNKLVEAVETVASRYDDINVQQIMEDLIDLTYDSVTHSKLEETLRNSEALAYVEDYDTGGIVGSHILGEIIQELGFDLIILKNANERFSNMDMGGNTAHIHVFDENNTNIKHVENLGTFNPDDPNIYRQEGADLPPRGTFNPADNMIRLGQTSDLSSFLHESAHLFMQMEKFYAKEYGLTKDQETMLKWLGVNSFDEMTREHEEKWAETFEVYLREGKAPSLKLREAFAAFGRWLSRIYQTLKDQRLMNADLTAEISEVFDRMLATEAEIEAAMANPAYDEMYKSQEAAGMTDAEWKKYLARRNKTVDKAQATMNELIFKELHKRRSIEWREEKKPLIDEHRDRLEHLPVYQILSDIKNYPMDWQVIKELTGATKVHESGLPIGGAKNNGVDPMEYADAYGYTSVKAMLKAIKEAPTLKVAAEEAAQADMVAKYGDVLNDGTIEEEANQAVHNDAQAAVLLQEIRNLNKKTGINREYLKSEAKKMIASMTFKKIQPGKFYRQEIKAAQRAALATTDAERESAKIQQLANHYLYREAVETKRRMTMMRKHIRRVQTKEYRTKDVDERTLGAMKVLANMFELRNKPAQDESMNKVIEWYNTQSMAGVDVQLMATELVEALHQINTVGNLEGMIQLPEFDEMTAESIQGVYEMLRHMRYVGGKLADRKRADRDVAGKAFAQHVIDKGGDDKPGKRGERVVGQESKRKLQQMVNSLPSLINMMRKLDGWTKESGGGKAVNEIYRRVEAGFSKKTIIQSELYEMYTQELGALHTLGINVRKSGRKEYILETGKSKSLTSEERFMIAMYWGTESSREAIREGYGMTSRDVHRIMSDLTVDQLNLVNATWKVNESTWPELASAAIARHGVAPPKLDATPFEVNGVQMTGGHMRLFYDSQTIELKNTQEQAQRTMEVVPSKAGSLNARVGAGGKPPLLDKNNIARQLEEVAHYIAFAEIGDEVSALLNREDVKDAIERKHGVGFYVALIKNIEGITGGRAAQESMEFLAQMSRWARRANTAKHLMFSPRNTIQQFASIPIVMREVGVGNAVNSFARFANPQTRGELVEFINDRSSFMENRASLVNREANEYINRMQASGQLEHMWNEFAKFGFTPQTIIDSLFAYPTWLARYEQAMEQHGDVKVAISEADTAVSESVGSGADIHMGGAFHKSQTELIKMTTVFGSWFNNYFQRIYRATEGGTKLDANAVMEITMLPFIVAILSSLVVMDEPRDDEDLWAWAAKRYAAFMLGTVPLIRELAATFSGFTPTTPLAGVMEVPAKAFKSTDSYFSGKKSGLQYSIDAAKIGTTALPVPGSGSVIRIMEFMESNQQLNGPLDAYQAVVEGKDRNK